MTYLSENEGQVVSTGWQVVAEWREVSGRQVQLVKRDQPGSAHVTVAKRIVTDNDRLYAELTECSSFSSFPTDE